MSASKWRQGLIIVEFALVEAFDTESGGGQLAEDGPLPPGHRDVAVVVAAADEVDVFGPKRREVLVGEAAVGIETHAPRLSAVGVPNKLVQLGDERWRGVGLPLAGGRRTGSSCS